MKECFIKLKPLNSFYFGSNKSFDDVKDSKNKKAYFLKGNIFPQQTAVLGMVRKKILEDNGILVAKERRNKEQIEKEEKYIGKIEKDFSKSSFGKIEKISSIQVYDKDNKVYFYCFGSLEEKKIENKFSEKKVLTNKGKKYLYEYNPKKYGLFFYSESGETKEESEIFIEIKEEGINRKDKLENRAESSLFMKQRYLFKDKDTYFGFYITLNDDEVKLKNGFVQLGDKYSIFYFEVIEKKKDINKQKIKNFLRKEKRNMLFMCSDAYVENNDLKKILELSEGMLLQNKKFKFIDNEKSKKYSAEKNVKNLISRGSILLGNIEEIKKILDLEENYKRIGFNNYFIINEEEK